MPSVFTLEGHRFTRAPAQPQFLGAVDPADVQAATVDPSIVAPAAGAGKLDTAIDWLYENKVTVVAAGIAAISFGLFLSCHFGAPSGNAGALPVLGGCRGRRCRRRRR